MREKAKTFYLNLYWPKAIGVLLIQVVIGLFVFWAYLMFTWIIFGEGADSLLYTEGNKYVWIASPIILPTLLNSYRMYNGMRNKNIKTFNTYVFIEVTLFLIYLAFEIWWGKTKGFHI
jgi:hypothetical protein